MRGLPSHFGTMQDIHNCMKIDPRGTKAMLQNLLAGNNGWFAVAELAENDPGIEDEIHRVRVEPVDPGADFLLNPNAPIKRVQYVFKADPFSQLARLGLTVAQVNSFIVECEARS